MVVQHSGMARRCGLRQQEIHMNGKQPLQEPPGKPFVNSFATLETDVGEAATRSTLVDLGENPISEPNPGEKAHASHGQKRVSARQGSDNAPNTAPPKSKGPLQTTYHSAQIPRDTISQKTANSQSRGVLNYGPTKIGKDMIWHCQLPM